MNARNATGRRDAGDKRIGKIETWGVPFNVVGLDRSAGVAKADEEEYVLPTFIAPFEVISEDFGEVSMVCGDPNCSKFG